MIKINLVRDWGGLDTIGKLLELLGNPHRNMKYIHIGGTNGKGSTASYIASSLE